MIGFVIERLPELLDGGVQAGVKRDERLGWPKLLAKLFTGQDVARPLEQQQKDFERLILKPDLPAVFAKLARPNIEDKLAKMNRSGSLAGRHDVRVRQSVALLGKSISFNGLRVQIRFSDSSASVY